MRSITAAASADPPKLVDEWSIDLVKPYSATELTFDTVGSVSEADPEARLTDLSKPVLEPADSTNFESSQPIDNKMMDVQKYMALFMTEFIDVVNLGLSNVKELQAAQKERHLKKCQEAMEQANKEAEAGILGKIFGWIAKIFGVIALAFTSAALIASGNPLLAALTITALVLTVMDIGSEISEQLGGQGFRLTDMYAAIAEACNASVATVNDIKKWGAFALQMVVVVFSAVGGGGLAVASGVNATVTTLARIKTVIEACTTLMTSGAKINSSVQHQKTAEFNADKLDAKAFLDAVSKYAEKIAKYIAEFMADLNAFLLGQSDLIQTLNNKQLELINR